LAPRSVPTRGVAAVESAIALALIVPLIVMMCDLGLVACQYNALSRAARNIARQAIVRGQNVQDENRSWGPGDLTISAAELASVAGGEPVILPSMDPNAVHLAIEWPDGTNREGDRVHVTVAYDHPWICSLLTGSPSITLKATCQMALVN
jgi:Flp pilus assembly protein TadG